MIINNVITSFENSCTPDNFAEIWKSVQTFADDNNVTIDIPHQARGL